MRRICFYVALDCASSRSSLGARTAPKFLFGIRRPKTKNLPLFVWRTDSWMNALIWGHSFGYLSEWAWPEPRIPKVCAKRSQILNISQHFTLFFHQVSWQRSAKMAKVKPTHIS